MGWVQLINIININLRCVWFVADVVVLWWLWVYGIVIRVKASHQTSVNKEAMCHD